MMDDEYPVWLPPQESIDFYSKQQLEPFPFVYDRVIDSIFSNNELCELVTTRTRQVFNTMQKKGVDINYLTANRLAVAGIEGEYARIIPFMVDAYIKSYEHAKYGTPTSPTQIPSYLYYPDTPETLPSDWVKPPYTAEKDFIGNINCLRY